MESYALSSIPNDLGIEEPEIQLPTNSSVFENFKSLPELVLNEEELKKYHLTLLNRLKNEVDQSSRAKVDLLNEANEMDIDEPEKQLKNFVDIGAFEIKTFKEQLLSVTIVNMDVFICSSGFNIESFLDLICLELSILKYRWSTIDEEVDLKPVFIRFFKTRDLVTFVAYYKKLEDKFGTILMDSNVTKLYEDHDNTLLTFNTEGLEEFYKDIHNHHLQRGQKVEVDIYSDYQVDAKEMVDVPKNLIDTVKNDIIEFRLRVLKLEKTKREREAINDKKKSRFKLKKLYHDISKTNTIDDEYEDKEEDFVVNENEDEEDELNDSDVERATQGKLKDLAEREFVAKAKIIGEQDANRHKLLSTYKLLQNYPTTIKQKRDKFYKDFVDIASTNNKIDKNLEKFYLDHANYLRFRDAVKRKEETRDANDKDIPKFINKLIEEFIGVEEDESLNNFVMGLVDENYPSKGRVVDLLKETLDEDAEVFVHKLWQYIDL